jgi:hypothetical protein
MKQQIKLSTLNDRFMFTKLDINEHLNSILIGVVPHELEIKIDRKGTLRFDSEWCQTIFDAIPEELREDFKSRLETFNRRLNNMFYMVLKEHLDKFKYGLCNDIVIKVFEDAVYRHEKYMVQEVMDPNPITSNNKQNY